MRRLLVASVLALLLAAFAAACGAPANDAAPPIAASVLIEPAPDDPRWFRDVEVPAGTDGYQLLEAAVDGGVESEFYPEFRSHFVQAILGVAPEGTEFWAVFVWNESNDAWEPLPVGADLFSVKEGHVIGWALVDYTAETPQLPTSQP